MVAVSLKSLNIIRSVRKKYGLRFGGGLVLGVLDFRPVEAFADYPVGVSSVVGSGCYLQDRFLDFRGNALVSGAVGNSYVLESSHEP